MKALKFIFCGITFLFANDCCSVEYVNELRKNGDIIFQVSQSSQSKLIQRATKSRYSHVGIVFICDKKKIGTINCINDEAYVLEAVEPVKYTSLIKWIKKGNNKYAVKRYKNHGNLNREDLIAAAEKFIGKHYDGKFLWDDSEIYCSELVWKVYMDALKVELSPKVTLQSYGPFDEEVTEVLKKRLGKEINYNEIVVAPEGLFNSTQLYEIFNNFSE